MRLAPTRKINHFSVCYICNSRVSPFFPLNGTADQERLPDCFRVPHERVFQGLLDGDTGQFFRVYARANTSIISLNTLLVVDLLTYMVLKLYSSSSQCDEQNKGKSPKCACRSL